MPAYSLIIPVFNESNRLPQTFDRIVRYVEQLGDAELIFVDDGSQDATVSFLQQHQIEFPFQIIKLSPNQGKGWAVRSGLLAATGQYRAFLDADLATPPQELSRLFSALKEGADVAIGSRIQSDGTDLRLVGGKPQPLIRRILGKAFRMVATRPFLGNIRDSQCGAKAFTAEAAQTLCSAQQIHRWAFDIELLYLAKKAGMKVAEVPVYWEAQDDSKLKPSISLAFDIIRELLQIAWIHRGTHLP